ncbi:hypothetical protein RA2_03017 [Roseovarius sp. A-2]|uniref:DUF1127 domain-containing protein n=1 Tax=Roseovarius sp. A-2 TaxID=1570360 RepID=UPI0009CC2499|nr:DUF1127 domain-containing protein [Roseovarius sp. A-2]GAW35949.1 hypothetical protein RA2_03017 [Roseovarius sp. A-2]
MTFHVNVHAQDLPRAYGPRRNTLGLMLDVFRQRRALLRLDDTALTDLGLTRREALREATRPFWDLP